MKRNFSSFIDGILEYTQYVEAPEKFLTWSALSTIAGALERRTWILFNGAQYVFPNEYVMLVGAAGTAKKSSSSGAIVGLLKEVDSLRFMSTQLTAASLVKQLNESGKDRLLQFENTKFVNSSLFLYSSEAAVTLKEITGSIIELLTDFYDCGPNGWHDKQYWSKATAGEGHTKIFNPCMNMLACSTPDWLVKTIGKSEIRGGFASRMLFVVQKEKSSRTVGWMSDEEIAAKNLSQMKPKLVEDLKQIAKLQGRYKADGSFGECFNAAKEKTERLIMAHAGKQMEGYYSRKLWHTLKLSQILAADTSNELQLTAKHFIKATELLESIEPEMSAAFGVHGDNKTAESLNLIWESIRQSRTVSKQDILRIAWRHADARTVNEHILTLVDMKRLKPEVSRGGVSYVIADPSPLI